MKYQSKVYCVPAQAFSHPLEAAAVSVSQRLAEAISCSLVMQPHAVSLYNSHCKLVSIIELECFSALA